MATNRVKDVLASAGGKTKWVKAHEVEDQTITIVDYEVQEGAFGDFFLISFETESGELHTLSNGGRLAQEVQALNAAGLLPAKVVVRGETTKYGGQTHYLEAIED